MELSNKVKNIVTRTYGLMYSRWPLNNLDKMFSLSKLSNFAAACVPKVKMNTGDTMPAISLGTYMGLNQSDTTSDGCHLRHIIGLAIDSGYRKFDTAVVYKTEEELGKGIRMKIKKRLMKRDNVFVTTKLWNTEHRKDQVEPALRKSLERLGLDYVDLYLMHWPMALNENYTFSDEDYMETWRGMERVNRLGLAKAIGVSNFNIQVQRVLLECSIKPAVLQIEIAPQITQMELVSFAQHKGLVVMGYSPLGSLVRNFGEEMPGPKMDNPILVEMTNKYRKNITQIVLRWLVDRSIVPVTKTKTRTYLEQNLDIFDFHLEQEDIKKINSLNTDTRFNLPSFWQNHKHYPFEKIEKPIEDSFVNLNLGSSE